MPTGMFMLPIEMCNIIEYPCMLLYFMFQSWQEGPPTFLPTKYIYVYKCIAYIRRFKSYENMYTISIFVLKILKIEL